MCWSWPVSLFFCSFEWATAAYLYKRNLARDRQYARAMASLASMETNQMFVWLSIDYDSYWGNVVATQFIVLLAWVLIPYSIINFISHVPNKGLFAMKTDTRVKLATSFFVLEYALILFFQYTTSIWTTGVGPNGHQMWPCAVAGVKFGGLKLYCTVRHFPTAVLNFNLVHGLNLIL